MPSNADVLLVMYVQGCRQVSMMTGEPVEFCKFQSEESDKEVTQNLLEEGWLEDVGDGFLKPTKRAFKEVDTTLARIRDAVTFGEATISTKTAPSIHDKPKGNC